MQYNRTKTDGEKTYSIDRFTFNVFFVPQKGLTEKIRSALDVQVVGTRQKMDVENFVTKKYGDPREIYQFGGFHVELYERENPVRLGGVDHETGDPRVSYARGVRQTCLRLDFNPNKCAENPVTDAVMHFLANTWNEFPYTWSLSRVDYALDVPGVPDDFYVLSRKTERFYGNTRYYGVKGGNGCLKVYDKRQEQKDKERVDIGRDLTRFEWSQMGNRDFEFKFDEIAHFIPGEGGTVAALLKFCRPELMNNALGVLDKRTRKKVKEQCFHPLTLDPSQFEILLAEYLVEYGIPLDLRRDWEKQFPKVSAG